MSMESIRHVVCPHCAAKNRFPVGKPAARARCGACHGALFAGHPVAVNAEQFDKHRRGNDIPVLVDVWAPWCGPCRMMAPMFERAAAELEPEVRLLKVNSDEEPGLAGELGVRGIPALFLLRGGKVVAQTAGAMDTRRLVEWTRGHLAEVV
jgi:thioredoxin 2